MSCVRGRNSFLPEFEKLLLFHDQLKERWPRYYEAMRFYIDREISIKDAAKIWNISDTGFRRLLCMALRKMDSLEAIHKRKLEIRPDETIPNQRIITYIVRAHSPEWESFIESFGLSIRTTGALVRWIKKGDKFKLSPPVGLERPTTLREFSQMTDDQLLSIDCFGKFCLKELREFLKEQGY